jgi:hypothetical protein
MTLTCFEGLPKSKHQSDFCLEEQFVHKRGHIKTVQLRNLQVLCQFP